MLHEIDAIMRNTVSENRDPDKLCFKKTMNLLATDESHEVRQSATSSENTSEFIAQHPKSTLAVAHFV